MTTVEIIRTSGEREEHSIPPRDLWPFLHGALDAKTFDTVNLRDGRVMVLDDNGYEFEAVQIRPGYTEHRVIRPLKPENLEATKLYHGVCIPGTTHKIVGDVAIVVDREVE